MKTKLLAIVLVLASMAAAQAAKPAQAGTAKGAATAPADAQIQKLLDLLGVRAQMELVMSQMKGQMNEIIVQNARRDLPDAGPELKKDVNAFMEEIWQSVSTEDLVQAVVPVYRKHLTSAEVEALIKFYSSPVGRKLIEKQPAIAKESMEAGSALAEQRFAAIQAKMETRMQEIVRKHSKTGGQAHPEVDPK